MVDVTPLQMDHMLHAVGRLVTYSRPRAHARALKDCYRNYFCSAIDPSWEDLVAKGLAERHAGSALSGGDPIYTVTEAGFALLLEARAGLLAEVKAARARLRRFDGV